MRFYPSLSSSRATKIPTPLWRRRAGRDDTCPPPQTQREKEEDTVASVLLLLGFAEGVERLPSASHCYYSGQKADRDSSVAR